MKQIVTERHENSLLDGSRYFHRLLAIIAVSVVPIAVIAALIFQAKMWQGVDRLPVPPEYQAGPIRVSMDQLDAYLAGPTQIELNAVRPVLAEVPSVGDRIAVFSASSPNGVADYPDDFDILGGRDAPLFQRVQLGRSSPRAALAASESFVAEASKLLSSGQRQSQTYQLRVIARDAHGIISAPQDISFTVEFAQKSAGGPDQVEREAPEAGQSPLQELARQIALTVDPGRTPRYFSVYARAQVVPGECQAANNPDFVTAYRAAFAHVQTRLSSENLPAFFSGVCGAWTAARNEARQAEAAAAARRMNVISENHQRSIQEAGERHAAEVRRNEFLLYAAIALLAVVLVSLLLSLLAMEKHSRTLRDLVEKMSSEKPAHPTGDIL